MEDPFETYRPAWDRGAWSSPSPHQPFSKLADRVFDRDKLQLCRMIKVFADKYGFLGLFREEFGTPLLPDRELLWTVFVAPDTKVTREGRLLEIDPATEGRRLVEQMLFERDMQTLAETNQQHLLEQIDLEPNTLILPSELRFQKQVGDFVQSGIAGRLFDSDRDRVFAYEDVQREYGVRILFDQRMPSGVSIISTREPVQTWRRELFRFAQPGKDRINRNLADVSPRAVTDKDGRLASSWSCPSLLKALYLMRYLDLVAGVRMQRCQAPGCHEYFRVPPRSQEKTLYCQKRCASRASSAMYRERQRRKN